MLCGGQTGADMELFGHAKQELPQSFLKPGNGIPSHDTGSRLPGMLDLAAFRQWFVGFMRQFAEGGGDVGVPAVDGKVWHRSYDRAERRSARHPINAWAEEQRLAPGQLGVDAKSNEIAALPKLLEMLTLQGKWLLPMPGTVSVKWRSRLGRTHFQVWGKPNHLGGGSGVAR